MLFVLIFRRFKFHMSQAPEQTARRENLHFLRWLPVIGSVALMVMVAVIATRTMLTLKSAIYWRQHSSQEILAAQAYEDNLMNIQNGMRDFVTMGDAPALKSCQRCITLEPELFDQLVNLTRDNPAQQQRLKALSVAMKDVFGYDARLIDIYQQRGAEAVLRTEQTGEGRAITGHALDVLKTFSAEEQKLLDARDAAEQADYHNAERLLIVGSVLAAVLLLLANFMASREMARRRRVEIEREKLIADLQQTLAEVKTLSGLIPICAWCKSVRNDHGYWQTVEQYVHSHSDASFSHSICPSCQEKFKDEIARGRRPEKNRRQKIDLRRRRRQIFKVTPLQLHEFHHRLGARFTEVNGTEVVNDYGDWPAEHAALRENAGLLDLSFRGRICLVGADRVRFLHGQVTNDVKKLAVGSARCWTRPRTSRSPSAWTTP